jgi:RNA polymerase sigma-70 factor (ECF subfamily)
VSAAAADAELTRLLGRERRRVVALLARSLGLARLEIAEEAVQTAALRALETWPRDGVPANAGGWLYRAARHAAIDLLRATRHDETWPEDEDAAEALLAQAAARGVAPPAGERFAGELDDDELALLFAACHPALPPASQVLLALRALGGFELAALAPVLLGTEAALAQRLARARSLLAGQPLGIPAGPELPPRRDAVLTALALMFHLGMQAARGVAARERQASDADPMAPCWEAIRLARALAAHPAVADGDADALAALLLLHGARLSGRIDAAGDIVPLPGQPRDRWDAGMIRLGLAHLQSAQRAPRLSRWHLQAGIAAEHALAPDHARTDWAAIVGYYEALLRLDPSAAPRLAHAIALAEAGAPAAALGRLQGLVSTAPRALAAHVQAALARAHERLGELEAARRHLRAAVAAAPHPADARLLARRLQDLG